MGQTTKGTDRVQRKQFNTPPTRVALFVTCMVDMIYPEVGIATVSLLEQHGIEVIFPEEQTCCGQPAFNSGFWDDARALAIRFLDIFEPLVRSGAVDAIIAPSGSCVTMTSHFYDALFEDPSHSADRRRAATVAAATFELTEFLVDVLGVEGCGARYAGKVTYHACCHLLRELHVDQQPRRLLHAVEGADVVEMELAEECCGFGGLFAVKNAGISTAMGERKTTNIADSGADLVALCDVSCMTHINGLLSRQGRACRAVHIAELLNNQLAPPRPVDPDAAKFAPASNRPRRWQDTRTPGE